MAQRIRNFHYGTLKELERRLAEGWRRSRGDQNNFYRPISSMTRGVIAFITAIGGSQKY